MADQQIYDIQFGISEYYDYNSPAVTLAEAKAQCIIDFDYDDSYLASLILVATHLVATYCNLSINNQQITIWGKADSKGRFRLPYTPITYVSSVVGNQIVKCDFTLPNRYLQLNPLEEFSVVYYTGFGKAIPADLKQGIFTQIAYLYENRGDQDGAKGLCNESIFLIQKYVDVWI